MGQKRPERCACGNRLLTEAQLNPKPRKPLARVSERNREKVRKQGGSTLKRGKGFAASPAQRAKVKGALSIISGQTPCDPMHIWDRSLGGCDDPLCVVPATRSEHEAYERKELDILPALVAGGYFKELAHIIEAHEVSLTMLLERVTGQRWKPAESNREVMEAAA